MGEEDGSARLWLASTGQMLSKLPTLGFGNTAWSKQGDKIAVPVQIGLLAWDTTILLPIIKPSSRLQYIARDGIWTPDGKLFVLSGIDGLVFDWAGDKTSRQITPYEGFVDFSPDSRYMVAVEGGERTPQIIDLYSGEVITKSQNPDPDFIYYSNCWSLDGERVTSSSFPGFWLVIWDPKTGQELAQSEAMDGFMKRANFSPDDQFIATPSFGGGPKAPVYIIDANTGETVRALLGDSGGSMDSKWSPDGKPLAVSHQNGTIKI
jgi:WD40 repeat protein